MNSIERATFVLSREDDYGTRLMVDDDNNVLLQQPNENYARHIGTLFQDPRFGNRLTYAKREDEEGLFRKLFAWSFPDIVLRIPEIKALMVQTNRYEYLIPTDLARATQRTFHFKDTGTERKVYIPLRHFIALGMTERQQQLLNVLHHEWLWWLEKEFSKKYMQQLSKQIREARQTTTVIPRAERVFHAYNNTPFSTVKVVIIGDEPYSHEDVADGLAFSSAKEGYCPVPLRNIFHELHLEYGYVHNSSHYRLQRWTQQGVLLLNTALTTEHNKPQSHQSIGWEKFIVATIQALNHSESPIVYLLWGDHARQLRPFIRGSNHVVYMSAHPSQGDNGFFNNWHFRNANTFLIDKGLAPVEWTLL